MVPITIVYGVYKPSYNCGAPHCEPCKFAFSCIRSPFFEELKRSQWGVLQTANDHLGMGQNHMKYPGEQHSWYPLVNVYSLRTGKSPFYSWVNQLFRLGHFQ